VDGSEQRVGAFGREPAAIEANVAALFDERNSLGAVDLEERRKKRRFRGTA
jgi:hypothetical protein